MQTRCWRRIASFSAGLENAPAFHNWSAGVPGILGGCECMAEYALAHIGERERMAPNMHIFSNTHSAEKLFNMRYMNIKLLAFRDAVFF